MKKTMHKSRRLTTSGRIGVVLAGALACASLFGGGHADADATQNSNGTRVVYGNIPPDQIEFLSTGDRIKSVAASGSMMAIWETLEHAERVECLSCIPAVEPLLYDANPRTREIAAWWSRAAAPLRRQPAHARDRGVVAAPPRVRRLRQG